MTEFVTKKSKNMVGKGENAGNQLFLLFPHFYFQKHLSFSVVESRDCEISVEGEPCSGPLWPT